MTGRGREREAPAVIQVASGREWRGGQRQTWLLARELQRLGLRDQIVVTGAGSELARRLVADGVPVCAVPWRLGLDPRALGAIRRLLAAHPSALVHAHDPHALTLAGLARLGGTRPHGPIPLVVTRRVVFPLRRRGFWTAADRVIAISPAVRTVLMAAGVSEERIVVIPSGVDLDAVHAPAASDLRARLGLPTGTPLALNVAALTPEKDHVTLLAAAARVHQVLPSLHWVIVGEGPQRAALERHLRELHLERTISLLGFVPDPERLFAEASVFVLSSTAEGLGSSVLAAWARDIPVIATRAGGLADLLASGAGLLVAPRDPAALADAVLRVVTQADLARELASRGRAEVARYGARGMAERVLAVYRSCSYSLGES